MAGGIRSSTRKYLKETRRPVYSAALILPFFLIYHAGTFFFRSTYINGADALIICTEWTKFREPDFERIKSLMKNPVVFDGRNLYKPEKLERLGFTYFYIGQKVD